MISARLSAADFTRIRSSSSLGAGSAISPSLRTLSSPGFSITTAFMRIEAAQFAAENPVPLDCDRSSRGRAALDAPAEIVERLLRWKRRFHDPGCPRLRVSSRVLARLATIVRHLPTRDDFEWGVGLAMALNELRDSSDVRCGERLFDIRRHRDAPLVASRTHEGLFLRPCSGNPYRYTRLLHRRRKELG